MARPFRYIVIAGQRTLREPAVQGYFDLAVTIREPERRTMEAAMRHLRPRTGRAAEPEGRDRAPIPPELVLAALGACQGIAGRLHAEALRIPLNGVSVRLEGRLGLDGLLAGTQGLRPRFRAVKVTVELDGPASPEALERLRAAVERHCPRLELPADTRPVKAGPVPVGAEGDDSAAPNSRPVSESHGPHPDPLPQTGEGVRRPRDDPLARAAGESLPRT
jgi:uncharacterized OsmC-like protein